MKPFFVLFALLLLTGCNEAATPEEALKHFLHAAQTQSVSEMKDYVSWHAYETYANPKGVSRLKKLLGNSTSYNVIGQTGKKVVNSRKRIDYYTAEVLSGGATALWVRVACLTEDQEEGYGVTFCWLDVIEEQAK